MLRRAARVAVLAVPLFVFGVPAHADETREEEEASARSRAARTEDAIRLARADAIRGDLAAARARVAERAVNGATVGDRAAALELLFVIDAWKDRGSAPPARRERSKDIVTEDWSRSFVSARSRLIDGAYADALAAFDELFGAAPDPVAALRAGALRELAREGVLHAPVDEPRATAPLPPMPETTKRETESRWYGWQTLISDGVAIPMTIASPAAGLGFYGLGAPIIHAAHGRWGTAFGSIGLRVGLPFIGGVIGSAFDHCNSGELCLVPTGLIVGGLVGVASAIALDAAVLAHEKIEREPRSATIAPAIAPRRGGADVGVSGTF